MAMFGILGKRKEKAMPDRRCRHIFAMLSDYLNGELSLKNCRDLERHLKGCPYCIANLESLKNTVELCRCYQVLEIPPPSKKVRDALLLALR
jgi:anti-sigma factor RsiW